MKFWVMSDRRREKNYIPVGTDSISSPDDISIDDHYHENVLSQPTSCINRSLNVRNLLCALLFLAVVNLTIQFTSYTNHNRPQMKTQSSQKCVSPARRQEWRSASLSARTHYVDAVLCLMQKPSLLHPKTSRYDDLVYAHITTGQYSHYAAAFLPWHRYFLHVYEKILKSECGYTGSLFYWDWSLDAQNLSASPIWDGEFGFGGNGNPDLPTGIYRGNCVTDGPFANTTRAYLSTNPTWRQGVAHSPHCLARGFFNGPQLVDLQRNVSAEAIETLIQQDSFEEFFKTFESGSHQVIPQFVHGDFMTYTAPNDPVFFLHHTQVDRIWWLWQQRDLETRLQTVAGARLGPSAVSSGFTEAGDASLDNMLPMGGLDVDIIVGDVMNTADTLLCYDYDF